jgi:hypothetical protein
MSVFLEYRLSQWRAVSIISGGQHAFVAAAIGNQAVAPDGYLLRAGGGSIGRVIGRFFKSVSDRSAAPSQLQFVSWGDNVFAKT